jgi:hypothetical protein
MPDVGSASWITPLISAAAGLIGVRIRPMPPVARHVLGIAAMITNRRVLARELRNKERTASAILLGLCIVNWLLCPRDV